jgi:hypothetical protein
MTANHITANQTKTLREQLLQALRGDQSHLDFDAAVADFPVDLAGTKPQAAPHTAWQLLEHMRLAQRDILEFSRNAKHKSPQWPEGYWPNTDTPASTQAWEQTIAAFREDALAMEALIADPNHGLFEPIEGGDGQTLLREALVLATHNSYHLGQFVYLKKILQPA